MFDPGAPKISRRLIPAPLPSQEPTQRRLMMMALMLLVACLAFVLYRDRDFWFPVTGEIADQQLQTPVGLAQSAVVEPKQVVAPEKKAHAARKGRARVARRRTPSPPIQESVPPATVKRTVLPPLEVEVVAGGAHRTLRPGNSSLNVDLEQGPRGRIELAKPQEQISASVASNAAEHTAVIAEPSDVVSHSVQPGYPMLARQMKVQGSVILQALIGRDGMIQDLRVLSGPPILATAAREAVKQWHFKPHYDGPAAVETEAKITVNFTISTN